MSRPCFIATSLELMAAKCPFMAFLVGWGYKTKNQVIVSAVAKFTAFGHTFAIQIVSNPQKKFSKTATFGKSAQFWVPKNGTLGARN